MSNDVVDLREFYISPLGQAVRRLLRRRLSAIWPQIAGETLVGLGYATPLLRPWMGQARHLMAVMPPTQGVAYWPREGPNCACLSDFSRLPFASESVDRIVAMHALETTNDPEALLREIWRVLKSQGRALIIVPNRSGLWAHSDRTPFGTGQPFSPWQLRALLRDHGFMVERHWSALYLLPHGARVNLGMANALEQHVANLLPSFGGVLVMEATKQLYAPIIGGAPNRKHRFVLPSPFPAPIRPAPAGRD